MEPVPPNICSMFNFLNILNILGTGDPAVSTFVVVWKEGVNTNLSYNTLNLSRLLRFMGESYVATFKISVTAGAAPFAWQSYTIRHLVVVPFSEDSVMEG